MSIRIDLQYEMGKIENYYMYVESGIKICSSCRYSRHFKEKSCLKKRGKIVCGLYIHYGFHEKNNILFRYLKEE